MKNEVIKEEILALKQSGSGGSKHILVGSPGMIVALAQLDIIDEYQLGVHPIILGNGLQLLKNITERIYLKHVNTKTFNCGAVMLYYQR